MGVKEPIALTKLGTDGVIAYACGKCGVVAAGVGTGTGLHTDEYARELATKHCGPWTCEECGADHNRSHQPLCPACWSARMAVRRSDVEAKRFEAAEKLREWDGPVYSEQLDSFFRDVGDLVDYIENLDLELPEYAWTCSTEHPRLDADSLIEMALDEAPAGAGLDAEDELRAFVASWNAKQTYEIWEPNYKRAVLLDGGANE